MGHVSDVHAEHPPATHGARNGDRVVKITSIDGVDRDGEPIADIATQRIGQSGLDIDREPRGLIDRFLRVPVRKSIPRHDALDAQARLVGIADTALDGDHTGLRTGRIFDDVRCDDIAWRDLETRRGVIRGKDEEILLDARVERTYGAQRTSQLEGAHNGLGRTLDHVLHNRATSSAATAMQAYVHTVARHRLAHRARAQAVRTLRCLDLGVRVIHAHRPRKPRQPPRPSRPVPSVLPALSSTHAFLSSK